MQGKTVPERVQSVAIPNQPTPQILLTAGSSQRSECASPPVDGKAGKAKPEMRYRGARVTVRRVGRRPTANPKSEFRTSNWVGVRHSEFRIPNSNWVMSGNSEFRIPNS